MRAVRSLTSRSLFLLVLAIAPLIGFAGPPVHPQAPSAEAEEDDRLPLEAARTISFTTAEGSWISLDVSPDGSTIVFDLLGDLYSMPFSGGSATRLTDGLAFDGQPRYSPDGAEIVFTSDADGGENLWILDLEVTGERRLRRLTDEKHFRYQSPEWTPDGRYVVASRAGLRSGSSKLWMFHVDGSDGINVTPEPASRKVLGAAFGADDRYVWFAQRTGNWQYNAIFPQYQLAVYDRDTGQSFTRTSRHGSAFRPTLSPDGRWLVYGSRHEDQTGLRVRDLVNGDERWLAYPVQHDDQESRATRDTYPGMSFTPDSTELVATYGGKIWRIPVDGGAPIEIPFRVEVELGLGPELSFDYPVEDSADFVVRQIRDGVPSPDGGRLAFTAMGRLWIQELAGGAPRRLTGDGITEAQPTWSPDGRWIAYATWSEEDGGHLHKVAAAGGDPVRLTTLAGIYQAPAFSPDGERVVAIRGPRRTYAAASGPFAPGAAQDLVWVPAAGGDFTVIAPTNGRGVPHFTEDPERIWLYGFRDGLHSIRWDGTDLRSHLKVTGVKVPDSPDFDPPAGPVIKAPRGDLALVVSGLDLYVLPVPRVGGDTPTISLDDLDDTALPVRKLTDIGGEFPAWAADGRSVHWSIGNAHVVYDLDEAERAEAAATASGDADPDDAGPAYEPAERRTEIRATRDIPEGAVVLRGGRAITMNGDEVIENADVVMVDNRIVAVGERGAVDVPEGARTIDVSGKTLVPGFVDTHAHLWPNWGIHKSQVWLYLANLAYGVTTTRDPQTATTDVLAYADRVRAGEMLGPRIYSTGPGVFWQEQIGSLDHARRVLRRYSDYYDTKTIKMYVAGNRQMRQWIIMAAREQRLMPTTEGSLNLKMNLTQALDGYPGQEHSLPVYPLYEDVVQLFARSGITYTPTLVVAYGGPWAENWFYTRENPHDDPKVRRFMPHDVVDGVARRRGAGPGPGPGGWFMDEEHVFPEQAEVVRQIVEAGGRAGVGSHGQFQGLGYHWELWAMQAGGMREHDALRVATLHGAEAIGLDGDLGSLEPGKLADVVVLNGNPLDDIRATADVAMVMINGRLHDGDTLDEVWPRERTLEGLYWLEDVEPETTEPTAGAGRGELSPRPGKTTARR